MKHIIIGNSAAGVNAAEVIRGLDKRCKITIVSDEDTPYYSRCLLPNYLAGEMSKDEMIIRDFEWYKNNNINILLGKKVIKVLDKEQKVILDMVGARHAVSLHYDKLLIATGSSPIFPSIHGIKNPMVFGFRTISDVSEVLSVLSNVKHAVVLGAGLIGLKAAQGLWKQGIRVTIIEKLSQVLPKMLDQKSANIITKCLKKSNIAVRTNSTVTEIIGKGDGVKLESGEIIECELVIVAVGVKPNTEFIEDTNIRKNQGILVDEYMRTNVDGIYAAGDVTETIDPAHKFMCGGTINAIWPSATRGGKIAGYNMVGIEKRYDTDMAMNSLEFFGMPVVSMGVVAPEDKGYEIVSSELPEQNIYKKLILRDDKIVGMVFVGDIEKAGVILSLIRKEENVSRIKAEIVEDGILKHPPVMERFSKVLHYPIAR